MRESQIYFRFFLKNFFFIVGPALFFATAGYLYASTLPRIYEQTEWWEFPYGLENAQTQVIMTDQAVGVMRSLVLQKELAVSEGTEVVIFKPSPLSISLTTKGTDQQRLTDDLEKVKTYARQKYGVVQVGQKVTTETKTNPWLFTGLGLAVGGLLGIITSLLKIYFQEF